MGDMDTADRSPQSPANGYEEEYQVVFFPGSKTGQAMLDRLNQAQLNAWAAWMKANPRGRLADWPGWECNQQSREAQRRKIA